MKIVGIVDDCIGCDTCPRIAPDFFKLNDSKTCAIVTQQPTSEREVDLCMEALVACPIYAIIMQ